MSSDLNAVMERLGRIDAKLDLVLERVNDHEDRIRRHERLIWIAAGVSMAGGSVIGTILKGFMP